jgi:internalin A
MYNRSRCANHTMRGNVNEMTKPTNVDLFVRQVGELTDIPKWEQASIASAERSISLGGVECQVVLLDEPRIDELGNYKNWSGMPVLPEAIKRATTFIVADKVAGSLSVSDMRELATFENTRQISLSLHNPIHIGSTAVSMLANLSHLESLDIFKCKGTIANLCSHLPGSIRNLNFGATTLNDRCIDRLPTENIASLELWSTKVTNDGVRNLTRFPKLKRLSLSGKHITFDSLATLPELNEIELYHRNSSDADFSQHDDLKVLRLMNCNLGDRWAKTLNPTSLHTLYLYRTGVPPFSQLYGTSNLRSLSIYPLTYSDGGIIEFVQNAQQIEEIDLDECPYADEVLSIASQTGRLRLVSARGSNIKDQTARRILSDDRIEQAIFSECDLSDACLQFSSGSRLSYLDLDRTAVTDVGVGKLAKLPELARLALVETQITDESCRYLRHAVSLRHLQLDGTGITDAGMKYVAELTGLELFMLSDTSVTAKGLQQLASLTRLRTLFIPGIALSDHEARELQTRLPYCRIVR